jgi:ribosome-binding factor A
MESKRQQKAAGVIQKDIADILQFELSNLTQGAMLTVTKVRITPDLGLARIYLSIFGQDAEVLVHKIRVATREIRNKLGQRIRNQMRIVPELEFHVDDSLDYQDRIDQLLKDTKPNKE